MGFMQPSSELFLKPKWLDANSQTSVETKRSEGDHPVEMDINYQAAAKSSAKVTLAWQPVSEARRRLGDVVDCMLTIERHGETRDGDKLDIIIPAVAKDVYDPVFATLAAASYQTPSPEMLAGCEVMVFSEYGPVVGGGMPVGRVGHGATGVLFPYKPTSPSVGVRLHLKQVQPGDGPLVIRLARVFFGIKYDPYVYNPHFELAAHTSPITVPAEFEATAARFVAEAREASKRHRYLASQSFVHPFFVRREGQPDFPMLVGTINGLFWYGMKPEHLCEVLAADDFVKEGDVVFDCGANAGQMALFFAKLVGPKGKVLAFDPFPSNYLQIEAQARLAGATNILSPRSGVGEKREQLKVSIAAQMTTDSAHGLGDEMAIDIHRIDDYIDERPTAIKLDIEGAEIAALRGAQRVLHECRPKIFCEFHTQLVGQFGHSVQDFFDAIPHDRYRVVYLEENGSTAWQTYEPGKKVTWSMPGTIKAFPR